MFKATGNKKFENQSYALKLLANTGYGLTGMEGDDDGRSASWSLNCLHVAASITHDARECIIFIVGIVEKQFPECKIVYVDTDSIFCENSAGLGRELEQFVNSRLASKYDRKKKVAVAFENEFLRVIVLKKKKYITSRDGKEFKLKGGSRQVHWRSKEWVNLAVSCSVCSPACGYTETLQKLLENIVGGIRDHTFTLRNRLGKSREDYGEGRVKHHAKVQRYMWREKKINFQKGFTVEYGHLMLDVVVDYVKEHPLYVTDFAEACEQRNSPVDVFEHTKTVNETVFTVLASKHGKTSKAVKEDWMNMVTSFKMYSSERIKETIRDLAFMLYLKHYEFVSVLNEECYYTNRAFL